MTGTQQTLRSPFIEHLGFRVVSVGPEGAQLALPIQAEFLSSVGVVHAGVYASLADTGLGTAIYGRLPQTASRSRQR